MTSMSTKKGKQNKRGGKKYWAGSKVSTRNSERTSPTPTQSSSHQQYTLHPLGFLLQPVPVQGAVLGEIRPKTIRAKLGWFAALTSATDTVDNHQCWLLKKQRNPASPVCVRTTVIHWRTR